MRACIMKSRPSAATIGHRFGERAYLVRLRRVIDGATVARFQTAPDVLEAQAMMDEYLDVFRTNGVAVLPEQGQGRPRLLRL
jgi:hypothetical protein